MIINYSLTRIVPFIPLTNPGQTHTIPAWIPPFTDKRLIRNHKVSSRQHGKFQAVDTSLCNHNTDLRGQLPIPTQVRLHGILLNLHNRPHWTPIHPLRQTICDRPHIQQHPPPRAVQIQQATQDPPSESQQAHQLQNSGEKANHQRPARPDRVRPYFGNGKIT